MSTETKWDWADAHRWNEQEKKRRRAKKCIKWFGATTFLAAGGWCVTRGLNNTPSGWQFDWIGDLIAGTMLVGCGLIITKLPTND